MDDESLDHQLRRLAARKTPTAPAGIEAEVWRRIRRRAADAAAYPVYLSARLLWGGLALAMCMGILIPLLSGDGRGRTTQDRAFEWTSFSARAPALPSARLNLEAHR